MLRATHGCTGGRLLLLLQLVTTVRSGAFQVYWNVPSFVCRKYQMEFTGLTQRFGIVQNQADEFRGERIAILYDPGVFPALLHASNDTILVRNGGVPQEGKLGLHLRRFREQLDELLPDREFAGLGVLDMESWRPVFRQNWAALQLYRNYSLELERRRQPHWSPARLREEATRRFEIAARDFMLATLRLAAELRPRARWGYYAYPYCFNWSAQQPSARCPPQVQRENDRMSWLFGTVDALYPSVYLRRALSAEQSLGMVRGRVREALRVAAQATGGDRPTPQVFVYYWFKYQDQRDVYVEQAQLVDTVTEIARSGADGLILWGSSADLDSRSKCEGFADYLEKSLGPALERARRRVAADGSL
ncbi:hyaluronidase-like isoform X2 [Phymastichus coffea]|uniref:hyaluronidase-like isoform X2 n=1 Tax=Phymastichus coffea TaxID=108790 RepID=UPI00273AB374|nr:hyaluronidase-like isoform X2 [Phymastichus coffea]